MYELLGAKVLYKRDPEVAHSMPTDLPTFAVSADDGKAMQRIRERVRADEGRFPYVTNSGRDVAGELL